VARTGGIRIDADDLPPGNKRINIFSVFIWLRMESCLFQLFMPRISPKSASTIENISGNFSGQ
jgi:hypothetical protein